MDKRILDFIREVSTSGCTCRHWIEKGSSQCLDLCVEAKARKLLVGIAEDANEEGPSKEIEALRTELAGEREEIKFLEQLLGACVEYLESKPDKTRDALAVIVRQRLFSREKPAGMDDRESF